jgi:hypothetical protein
MLEKLVVYFHEGSGRAHLDCHLSYRLVLTRYHHQESRLSLQQHPQLRRLSFSDAGSFIAKSSFCSVVYSSCSMEGRSQSSSLSLLSKTVPVSTQISTG